MMFQHVVYVSLIGVLLLAGCSERESGIYEGMSLNEIIRASKDAPVETSVRDVAYALAGMQILVPTGESEKQWAVGTDKNGDTWIYIYTDEAALLSAMPGGSKYVEIAFADAFSVIETATKPPFRGIFLTSSREDFYLIPAEFFGEVRTVLDGKKSP